MKVPGTAGIDLHADISDRILDFLADTRFEDLPDAVVERVKKSILDVIGVGVYGTQFEAARPVLAYVLKHSAREEATVIREGVKVSAFDAALVNGTFVHCTEFAEGFSRALVHPGNSIVPGVLALAERERRSGRDVLLGAALAYELNIRMGKSVEAPFNLVQGLHPPAVLGCIAAAAGCAKAVGLSRDRIADAVGISVCQTPTALMEAMYQETTEKDLFQGYTPAMGVQAADMAAAGITGVRHWVGPWYHAVPRHKQLDRLTDRLGEYWNVSSGGIRIKTRPVMGMAQPTCFALYDLFQTERFDPDLVEDILVESSKRVRFGDIPEVDTIVAARGSLQFLAAAAVVHQEEFAGDYYLTRFLTEARIRDPKVQAMMKKVRLGVDPEFDYNLEHAQPSDDPAHYIKFEARVTITLRDGRKLVAYKDVFAAGTGNMDRETVARKFRACVDGIMPVERADEVIENVWRLDALSDAGDLSRLMAGWQG